MLLKISRENILLSQWYFFTSDGKWQFVSPNSVFTGWIAGQLQAESGVYATLLRIRVSGKLLWQST